MEFVKSAIQETKRFLRFRYSEPRMVQPVETPGSSMSRRVFLAEAEDVLGSREKRGLQTNGTFEACIEELRAPEGQQGGSRSGDLEAAVGDTDYWTPPVDMNLVGLALSGGGIRSATFCLGALQILGERRVLRHVDYLSTVSGGGYIGSFWTCFLAKSKINGQPLADVAENDGAKPFQDNPLYKLRHVKGKEEVVAFQRLRNYANYLMVGGLWDAIRGPTLIVRGLFINFLMVLPYILLTSALVTFLFAEQIRTGALGWAAVPGLPSPLWGWALGIAFFVAVVLSTVLQSTQTRRGKADARSRNWLFRADMAVILAVLVVIWIDFQPKLIHALYCSPNVSPNCWLSGTVNRAFLFDGAFWSAASAVMGTTSAIMAGLTASRSAGLKAKLALAAVGILVPLSFLFLHFLLSAWAVFGPPEWIGLPDWSTQYAFAPGAYLAAAVVLLLVSGLFFDVNTTSLHNFYRDSLSRTFLFSVQNEGGKEKIEEEDDLRIGEVDIQKSGGPYHLINATVNNPDLEEEALRGRRSDFFVFGPQYSGSNRLGYCPTKRLERADKSANLGTALAVSAAALAPNMGEKTKPLLTFLLAMLNLRVGYWLPSPTAATAKEHSWLKGVGPFYFLAEMLGLGSSASRHSHVNLSDGGHIENLGIFELLRRRCKYIIAIDAEVDRDMTFNGLATLIRLARTDMGVDIDIDVEDLRKDADGLSRRHWVLGRIDYGNDQYGELIYIKSSLTGSENEYITEYRSKHPDFPHQTTSDQFFDEVQFEAYRALGYKVGGSIFLPVAEDVDSTPDAIFAKLRARDTGAVRFYDAYFELLDRRRSIDRLLADPALYSYAREIVPELDTESPARRDSHADAELPEPPSFKLHQVCNEQLQLMERSLLALRLDDPRNRRRRSNRGWMNLFRRWGEAPTFQRMWAASIANYGGALQDFCGVELGLRLNVEWDAEPEKASPQATARRYIATLSAIHHDREKSPRFRVATATVESRDGRKTLTDFELHAPYTGVGLREQLFRAWEEDKIWQGTPTFDLSRTHTPDLEATVRALVRSHFLSYAKQVVREP